MCAKYFHGEMAFQTKVVFLGLPVYNSVDNEEIIDANISFILRKSRYSALLIRDFILSYCLLYLLKCVLLQRLSTKNLNFFFRNFSKIAYPLVEALLFEWSTPQLCDDIPLGNC